MSRSDGERHARTNPRVLARWTVQRSSTSHCVEPNDGPDVFLYLFLAVEADAGRRIPVGSVQVDDGCAST